MDLKKMSGSKHLRPKYYEGWSRPLCLVENGPTDGQLRTNKHTAELLHHVTDPVTVVCILGYYRTGKSYLLNKLAKETDDGFEIGATVEAKTKGIWIWCIPHPEKDGHCLALMDTEGLGDPMKGDNDHDMWICVLTVLLSHLLIYNTVSTIDQRAIENLNFVTKMAHLVRVRSVSLGRSDESELLAELSPIFVWVIRDFMLNLEIDGRNVTQDEYLEHCLMENKNDIRQRNKPDYNRIRKELKKYFPKRQCFALPTPTDKLDQLTYLNKCPDSDLHPTFKTRVGHLCKFIHSQVSARTLGGRSWNGSIFSSMVECYVDAIRRGDVPCIESVLKTTADRENSKAIEEGLAVYRRLMQETLEAKPLETIQEFMDLHSKSEEKALGHFSRLAVFNSEGQYTTQFEELIAKEKESFRLFNEPRAKKMCFDELQQLYKPLNEAIMDGKYMKPGGYQDYLEGRREFRKAYLGSGHGRGLLGKEVLEEFLESIRSTEKLMMNADEKMTESKREPSKSDDSRREIADALIRSSTQLEQMHHDIGKEKRQKEKMESENERLKEAFNAQKRYIRNLQERLRQVAKIVPENEALISERRRYENLMKEYGFSTD